MGSLRIFNPVKLFVGILVSDKALVSTVVQRLVAEFGEVEIQSALLPFTYTDYYRREMGSEIDRLFISFAALMPAERLPEIKRTTNAIEEEFRSRGGVVERPVNLDPGYMEFAKVILASTKNFSHRIYLGNGIFGEVTMHFKSNGVQFFPWTYPDYQSKEYQDFFAKIRGIYRGQLRTLCLIR